MIPILPSIAKSDAEPACCPSFLQWGVGEGGGGEAGVRIRAVYGPEILGGPPESVRVHEYRQAGSHCVLTVRPRLVHVTPHKWRLPVYLRVLQGSAHESQLDFLNPKS